jgi:hypothetical protein
VPTFKSVVEHIHGIVLAKDDRSLHAKTALEILLTLAKKTSSPPVDAVWINDLLKRAAWGRVDDETFAVLLRFSALRKEDVAAVDPGVPPAEDHDNIQQGGANITESENPLLDQVLRNIEICGAREDGWQDDAVYGGLIAIRDIPRLQFYPPNAKFLRTLSKAMEKGENDGEDQEENKKWDRPFRVRKVAYDVVVAARDGWLKLADLRETLKDLDFPRKMHSVVIESGSPDHRRSFLEMVEILSKDENWRSYLREAMDIWLPLHHEGSPHALHILTNVGELLLPRRDGYDVDTHLEIAVQDEWTAVPGRSPMKLTLGLLEPLAEVTQQFRNLSFFTESDRLAVLAAVRQVIPSLERRRDGGYSGPGDDIRRVIGNLLGILREPIQSGSRYL